METKIKGCKRCRKSIICSTQPVGVSYFVFKQYTGICKSCVTRSEMLEIEDSKKDMDPILRQKARTPNWNKYAGRVNSGEHYKKRRY